MCKFRIIWLNLYRFLIHDIGSYVSYSHAKIITITSKVSLSADMAGYHAAKYQLFVPFLPPMYLNKSPRSFWSWIHLEAGSIVYRTK